MIRFYYHYRTQALINLLSTPSLNHYPLCGFSLYLSSCTQLAQEQVNYVAPAPDLDVHIGARFLQNCIISGDLASGKTFHCQILKKGGGLDLFGWNILLNLYVKSEILSDAHNLFDEMPSRNTVSFVTLIQGFSELFPNIESTELFVRLHREGHELNAVPNQFTFSSVLQACATMENLTLGKQIHCHVQKNGLDIIVYVSNALMDVYAKCGLINDSVKLFNESKQRNEVSWNTLIVGYVNLGSWNMALALFSDM